MTTSEVEVRAAVHRASVHRASVFRPDARRSGLESGARRTGTETVLVEAVGVVAGSALEEVALAAWVSTLGYATTRMDGLRSGAPVVPKVLLVRDPGRLTRLPSGCWNAVTVIAVVDADYDGPIDPRALVLRNDAAAPDRIRTLLAGELGGGGEPVSLSRRECEVLSTYAMGATVKETAARHLVSECTVRTHYRRASQRYKEVGRPIDNKSHLLLRMVADGWLGLDGSPGPRAREGMVDRPTRRTPRSRQPAVVTGDTRPGAR